MKVKEFKQVCDEFYIEGQNGDFKENPVLDLFPSAYDDYNIVKIKAKSHLNNSYIVVQIKRPRQD